MIKLVKLIDDEEHLNDVVSKVLSWARQAYEDGFGFSPHTSAPKSNIVWMKIMTINHDNFYPKLVAVQFDDYISIVIKFNSAS